MITTTKYYLFYTNSFFQLLDRKVDYFVSHVIKHGHPVSLNANHTHFLLVDDGVRGRYQGVAEFRAKLEKKISQPTDAAHPEGE